MRQSFAIVLGVTFLMVPDVHAWPGHKWENWREVTAWTKPDLKTDQVGKKDLVPLLSSGVKAIKDVKEWEPRRKNIAATIKAILGEPTNLKVLPPKVEVLGEEILDDHIRRHIKIRSEADDWIPAYLLLPKDMPDKPVPAMICPHYTDVTGKKVMVGLERGEQLAFALRLVRRGYVCIAPDMIGFGERIPPDTQCYHDSIKFYKRHPKWSYMGKMIWDTSRVIDYLETLPYVDSSRIGSIGHSHGSYSTLFPATFEPRIALAIASCGFDTFRNDALPHRWSHMTPLIPQLGTYLPAVESIPFDLHHILALIAPRPLFVWYTTNDSVFDKVKDLEALFEDVRSVYGLYGAVDDLVWRSLHAPHSFPELAQTLAYHWLDERFFPKEDAPEFSAKHSR